jgi:nucleotide-binding universal stress UspA family protein
MSQQDAKTRIVGKNAAKNKVVVGYNGSESSGEAVMWAASQALARHVPLRIVSCFELPVGVAEASLGWGVRSAYDAIRDAATESLETLAADLRREFPDLVFTSDVPPGPAATALLAGVSEGDLVVVGSSSHQGAAAFWLGTTPRSLVHHSPAPVAVVRGAASRGKPDRVVVGIDGSGAADRAVEWAADEADRHGVELVLVHGWTYPYSLASSDSTRAREITQIDADTTLVRAVNAARERCGSTVTGVLVESTAVSALLDTVRDGDLLVVGSRGRGPLTARLFGSTVNSVLESCAIPVVVVRGDPSNTDDEGGHVASARDADTTLG